MNRISFASFCEKRKAWTGFLSILTLIFWVSPVWSGYWAHRTPKIKGKHVFVETYGVRYIYIKLDAKRSATFTLTSGRSVQFRFYPERKGNLRIQLFRDQKPIRTWQLKGEAKIAKTFLEKGHYRIEATGPVLLRYYEWKNVQLKGIPPVGGGYPATLLVRGKKYTYYRVHGDTTVNVKVKGKAIVWFYLRADVPMTQKGATVTFEVSQDNKPLKIQTVHLRLSKIAQFQDLSVRPSRPYKMKLHVPKGVHEYQIRMLQGSGYVKFYLEKKMREFNLPKKPKDAIRRLKGLGTFLMIPWSSLVVADLPGNPRHHPFRLKISANVAVAYESNPWKLPDTDLEEISRHTFPYPQLGIKHPEDVRIQMDFSLEASSRWGTWTFPLKSVSYQTFQTRNFYQVAFQYATPRLRNRWVLWTKWASSSSKYIRPAWFTAPKYSGFFSLMYQSERWELGLEGRLFTHRTRPRLEVKGIQTRYRYAVPFEALSGIWTRIRTILLGRWQKFLWSGSYEVGEYRVEAYSPWDLGYTHRTHTWSVRLQWVSGTIRPYLTFRWRNRTFLTPARADILHFGRIDFERLWSFGAPIQIHAGGIKSFELFLTFETRRVSYSTTPTKLGSTGIYKDYQNILFGLRWKFEKAWRWLF